MKYLVFERPRLHGYREVAGSERPHLTTSDLKQAVTEADCICGFGLAAFVWDGEQCVYDPEGRQLAIEFDIPGVDTLF